MPDDRGTNTGLIVLVVVLIAVLLAVLLFWRAPADDDADIEVDLPDQSGLVIPAPSGAMMASSGASPVVRA